MSLGHGASIVRDGLVLHLDAANPKSYPGSGTTWTDLSGNSNNGTLVNSPTYNTENAGNFIFDASNDSVSIPHSSIFNFNSVFTVSSWIKVNSFSTSSIYNVVSKKSSYNNTQPGWSCQYDYRTTGVLQFRNNDGSTLNDNTPTSNVNNTSFLNQTSLYVNSIWVINGSSIKFYINGQQQGTGTASFTNTDTTQPIYIGKTITSSGDSALFSNLSNISIYNRALSAEEVRQNFEALRGRYGI